MPSSWNKGRLVEPNEKHVSITQGTLVTKAPPKGRTGQRSSWNTGTPIADDVNKASSEANQMDGSSRTPTEQASTVAKDPDDNIPFNSTAFLKFMDAVGGIESNNGYGAIGGYNNHYLGKYQFGKAALRDVGIGYTMADRERFLGDPEAQDEAMEKFTLQNHNYLKARSEKYRSMTDREKLGILGYAHNQGRGGALRFLETGQSEADGFGTDAKVYIEKVNKALG